MTFKSYNKYLCFIKANQNFTGVCIVLHPNGKKWFECNFVNGKRNERQYGWHPNGKKWYEYNFVNGKQHGKQYCWYENGQKEYEYNFVNENLFGIQLKDGKTCEEIPKENSIWYILVKETI